MAGFLKAVGQKLYNGAGEEVLLRGVGLGNWLLPEGYMWKFGSKCDRPRKIEALILDLVGEKKAEQFWERFRKQYITKSDIKKIADEGYNSIRIPFNYRVVQSLDTGALLESGMQWLDEVIDWCTHYKLYVILDLHGAPGGQTGTNIDDSEADQPGLFIEEKYKKMTRMLWEQIAKRYCLNETVCGYDLLNEPLPEWFSDYKDQVMPFYHELRQVIRKVDPNHMIILEGVHWSTHWDIFDSLAFDYFDDNYMLQFHKYWSNPDLESIQSYLDFRTQLNVPIFMGEGGENNKEWYTGVFPMYDDLNISWNFWTWKKLDTLNSPCSIPLPKDWQHLLDYIEGGSKPSAEKAWTILEDYLYNIHLENCNYNKDVVDYMFRRIPIRIPAEYYSYKGPDIGFYIKDEKKGVGLRQSDGTGICFLHPDGILNYKHYGGEEKLECEKLYMEISQGDWYNYRFEIGNKRKLDFKIKVSRIQADTFLGVYIDNQKFIFEVTANNWHIIDFSFEVIKSGSHIVQIKCEKGAAKFEWIALL